MDNIHATFNLDRKVLGRFRAWCQTKGYIMSSLIESYMVKQMEADTSRTAKVVEQGIRRGLR